MAGEKAYSGHISNQWEELELMHSDPGTELFLRSVTKPSLSSGVLYQ